ncbi:hypothetical protein MGYG_07005 [Nannizzia gypsea CBS 118893]|uniref:Uncharacterized protein n=1 Tax=Arthroderma gypseum (strain ATCC MYA-4604 / CBS 118893) TaxID=535722 RepID=E4V1T6_ARTGP|nr:hypothetical protein MGYG_07005 [Nannizzia gypsea CBS 118893]EFR04001.1 hypothetical protein MGYG_07005 [Nannizzia gypsea CBS 118893]
MFILFNAASLVAIFCVALTWAYKWLSRSSWTIQKQRTEKEVQGMALPYSPVSGESPVLSPTPVREKPKYRITMGLKRMDKACWLVVDDTYNARHQVRANLFNTRNREVSQCLPEAKGACNEALKEVSSFLCRTYPNTFELKESTSGAIVRNKRVGEEFPLENGSIPPLEAAARLAMEDMTILLKNDSGDHYVAATSSAFLIGWSANTRMGSTLNEMHAPVPQWARQIAFSVNKFMARLTPESPMERSSYFVQVIQPGERWESILFQPDGLLQDHTVPTPDRVLIRRERQTFSRLPETNGILFTVKTTVTFLEDLPLAELQLLAKDIESWPEDMAAYKGRSHWGETISNFCRAKEATYDVAC